MRKTLTFASIHFTIAFSVAYALTGDVIIGSLVALLEPMVNTVAFYFHEKVWSRNTRNHSLQWLTKMKTISFASVHFGVAFGVVYLLTGDLLVGGIMALLEPALNTIAYYFHEQNWQRKERALILRHQHA
jgi:uncharacterized membrane protein